MNILVVNGPNLNMLGIREPEKYGHITLDEINNRLKTIAKSAQVELECFQSNSEGEIINKIQNALNNHDVIIINPAGFTHSSVAIRDAIILTNKPCIEVHLSNIYQREEFRHKSFISDIAIGVISGFGYHGYEMALNYAIDQL